MVRGGVSAREGDITEAVWPDDLVATTSLSFLSHYC